MVTKITIGSGATGETGAPTESLPTTISGNIISATITLGLITTLTIIGGALGEARFGGEKEKK